MAQILTLKIYLHKLMCLMIFFFTFKSPRLIKSIPGIFNFPCDWNLEHEDSKIFWAPMWWIVKWPIFLIYEEIKLWLSTFCLEIILSSSCYVMDVCAFLWFIWSNSNPQCDVWEGCGWSLWEELYHKGGILLSANRVRRRGTHEISLCSISVMWN